ncbi:TatD family hydrolase [uncultured Clostridium sp.]|uniref:TatD family hydrolase n=1 Tax=uncultured Clostridium sp. TaxID=59620 RepID=UPI00280B0A4F|nr:TatD family hydrolase [uncultured Clostridium sp.]
MENKYIIYDTHAHYDDNSFDEDRENILSEIKSNGVALILNCASSYESIEKTYNLTIDNDFIYGALGIHPENSDEFNDTVENEIINLINKNEKILAIGEIGLDYYWDENPSKEVQKEVFRRQMKLAEKLNLPVVIHDREAHSDTLEILKEFPNVKGILHCFSGSVEFAMECIKLGYYIGIGGVVTFKNAKKVVEVVSKIPMEKILVETDAPYMSPVPNRGKRNKSDYIAYIIEQIAKIRQLEPKEVNLAVNDNFKRLIGKDI